LRNGFRPFLGRRFSHEICPLEAVKLFQHNMDYYWCILKPNLIYLDTIGGLPGIECYDPCHPLTRGGTREARLSVMRVPTNAGAVLGAEGPPQDWNLKLTAFLRRPGPDPVRHRRSAMESS
jgi:hypothetical protein